MTKQRYAITKYSKKTCPNTFRQLQKQRGFKNVNQVYGVYRIRPSSDEYIGHFTTLTKVNAAILHHAYKVLKTTTELDVRINQGRGFKKVKM
jgi:hypothetical protein